MFNLALYRDGDFVMVRSILAATLLSLLFGNSVLAQSCSVPSTLTNGTNADATQVMANFNALLSCVNSLAAGPAFHPKAV
jgi:hypothetical protein